MRTFAKTKEEPTEAEIERTLTSIRTDLITQATQEGKHLVPDSKLKPKTALIGKSKQNEAEEMQEGMGPVDEAK